MGGKDELEASENPWIINELSMFSVLRMDFTAIPLRTYFEFKLISH